MKTFAVKEKGRASETRQARPYAHHPSGLPQCAQHSVMRKILRPDEAQSMSVTGEHPFQTTEDKEPEEVFRRQPEEEEEESNGAKTIQRQASKEQEKGPENALQRQPEEQDEEEPTQGKLLQRQTDNEEEEEPVRARVIQRQVADRRGIWPSRFGYVGPQVKAQQAEIQRILHSNGAQAKLTIGQPNDKYEQEADRIADQVMAMSDTKLQRQPETEGEEKEEDTLQTRPLADQITPLVQRQEEPPEEEKEEPVQAKFKGGTMVQRLCPECEEATAQRHPNEELGEIQTKPKAREAPEVTPAVSSRIQSLQGGGQPLSKSERSFFEPRFGINFSTVRIHNDTRAASVARSVNARAFTLGHDIAFGAGEYSPGSSAGRALLAHELTHSVQQNCRRDMSPFTGTNGIQRALVLPPQSTGVQRVFSKAEIRDAIRYNRRMFRRRSSFRIIRDVIGIPLSLARSDRALAIGIARWQADHGLAQDGKIGVVTLMFILEELQAEGQTRDASALRRDFRGSTGRRGRRLPDINASHCRCRAGIRNQITHFQGMVATYQMCGSFPWITTGDQVEACVGNFGPPGGSFSGGTSVPTWSGTCRITVGRAPGPCGPLHEQITRNHEEVHCVHGRELQKLHTSRAAFDTAYNSARYWADDEIGAYRADIAVARWMLRVLDRLCGGARGDGRSS